MEATPASTRAPVGAGAPTGIATAADPTAARRDAGRGERDPDAEQMSLGRRLRQPRTIISIAIPVFIIGGFVGHQRRAAQGSSRSSSSTRTRGSSWPPSSSSTPASRCAGCAGRSCCAAPACASRSRTRPRSSSCRGSSTASSRPSSATCTAPTCSRSTARPRCRRPSGRSSSSASSTCSPSPCSGSPPATGRFRDGLPPAIQVVFGVALVVMAVLAIGLFTMRNFGRRIIVALRFLPHQVLELYDRFEEGVFGALAAAPAAGPRRS